jgi:type IV pilus assembly protein PilX
MQLIRRTLGNQRGAVLVVGLLLLVVLTLLGVAAMQSTTVQERMAGNMREQEQAFQSAEAALRAGEDFVQDTEILPAFNGTNGLYAEPDPGVFRWVDQGTWSGDDSRVYPGQVPAGQTPPRFIVEQLPFETVSLAADEEVSSGGMYRVTARGVGGLGRAVVVLESTCLQ